MTRTGGENEKTQLFLSTGIPGARKIKPYSGGTFQNDTTTWSQAVKAYWTNEAGDSLTQIYVASPIYHAGTFDAEKPVKLAASTFRPGISNYGFKTVSSVYRLGDTVDFSVASAGIENTAPYEGDVRVVATQFRLRSGYSTVLSGTFSNFTDAQFGTKSLSSGLYSLVVTFTTQRYNGSEWVDTGAVKNLATNITMAGTIRTASAAEQTDDSLMIVLSACGVMLLFAAAFTVVMVRKQRVR